MTRKCGRGFWEPPHVASVSSVAGGPSLVELGAVAVQAVQWDLFSGLLWKVPEPMPEYARDRILSPCRPGLEVDFVFSGLPSSIAGVVESDFARAGYPVVSNSKNHRMDEDVPLLVPEINPDHLELIPLQKKRTRSSGFIVTNPNCTTIAPGSWRWRRCTGPSALEGSAW